MKSLKDELEWYIAFADYVKAVDPNLHENACEGADMLKKSYEE